MQIDAFFSLLTLPLHFQIPKSKQKQTSRHLKPCNADSVGEDKDKKRVVIISTGNHFSRLLFNPLVDTKTRHFCSFICACYFTDTRIPCVCVHVAHTSYYRVSNFSPPVVYCFLHTNFLSGLRVIEIYVRRKEERHCIIVYHPQEKQNISSP